MHDWQCDVICGGFPCQDISLAGAQAGIDGSRSGLWREMVRVVHMVRPRFVVVENVSALRVRGLGRVLGDLACLGFDAEWSVLSACALGAPHTRERVFIVAYAHGQDGKARLGPSRHSEGSKALQPDCLRERRERWLQAIAGADRGVDGIPDRLHRLEGLGNAVPPPMGEFIGRRLLGLPDAVKGETS